MHVKEKKKLFVIGLSLALLVLPGSVALAAVVGPPEAGTYDLAYSKDCSALGIDCSQTYFDVWETAVTTDYGGGSTQTDVSVDIINNTDFDIHEFAIGIAGGYDWAWTEYVPGWSSTILDTTTFLSDHNFASNGAYATLLDGYNFVYDVAALYGTNGDNDFGGWGLLRRTAEVGSFGYSLANGLAASPTLLITSGGTFIGDTSHPADGISNPIAPVPEPVTMLLFGTGLIGLAGGSRLRKKKKHTTI
jgi:hypothetical protein